MEEVVLLVETEETVEEVIKTWQWVYRTENSPIWNITQTYMSKEEFNEFVNSINEISKHNPIVEFRKIKITKVLKSVK